VRTDGGDFWADEEAVILGAVGKDEARPPFVLRGWDEAKNERAAKENRERVKIYGKMMIEWQDYELARRSRGSTWRICANRKPSFRIPGKR
jgi:hypothetical protein